MSISIDTKKFDKLYRLFSDDKKWALLRPTQTVHVNVSLKKTSEEQIRNILTGPEIDAEVFARVRMQLEYENYLSKNRRLHYHVLDFLHSLNFYGIRPLTYTDDHDRWMSARGELENLLANASCQECYHPQDDVIVKGDAILELRAWGYKIPIIHGLIQQAPEDVGKFADSMRYYFDQLGGASVLIILHRIERLFLAKMGRYMFHHSPAMLETPRLDIPWGYLFNVALSYWAQDRKLTDQKAAKILIM